jgi:hypothetical protein
MAMGNDYNAASHSGDTRHKETMTWTKRTFWAVFAYTFVTSIIAVLSFCTVRAVRDQVDVMLADLRPWVGQPKIYSNPDGQQTRFILVFTNSGKTPTDGLYIDAKITGPNGGPDADKFCAKGVEQSVKNSAGFTRFSLVPGSPFVVKETPAAHGPLVAPTTVDGLRHIVGCVVYCWQRDPDALYQTEFVAPLAADSKTFDSPLSVVYTINPTRIPVACPTRHEAIRSGQPSISGSSPPRRPLRGWGVGGTFGTGARQNPSSIA